MIKIIFLTISFIIINTSLIDSQTWVRKNAGYGFWSIEKDFAGNIYAGTTGTARGIFKSTDGGETWTNVYSTGASNYLDIAFDPLNNVYVANSTNGLIISTDGGNNFTTIPTTTFGGNAVNTVACGQNGLVLVGVTSGGVYRSTDYGSTFTQTLSGYSIVSLEFDKFDSNRVYAGSSSTTLNGFFVSTDAGQTFSGPFNNVNVWEILQKQDSTLFTFSTSSGYPVSKSTDLGLTWTLIGNTPAAIRGACLDLVEDFYAAGNGGVYKSTDGGLTFINFNLTFSSNKIISYQNKILVAVSGTTNGGIYIYEDTTIPVELVSFTAVQKNQSVELEWRTATETNNLGFEIQRKSISQVNGSDDDWKRIGFVFGSGTITEPKSYSFIDENVLTGTYKYRLKQIDYEGTFKYSNEIEINIFLTPGKFELFQNFPNPFNPSTKISWESPISGWTVIKVFDILGNEVAVLLNEFKEEGKYELNFSASDFHLSSGTYIYKLIIGEKTLTKKMILLQ